MTMGATADLEQQVIISKGRARPTYGYYRQPNGWITVSPATDLEELRYTREGWQRLARYGTFEMSTQYAADHPLEMLFMQGGAHELSLEQVLQTGLYLDPPLVPTCRQLFTQYHKGHTPACWAGARRLVFPQLEGVEVGPYPCRFCGGDKPTMKARDQHEKVIHKDELGDIRTGQTLADALVSGLRPAESTNSPFDGRDAELARLREELAALKAQKKVVRRRTAK